MMSLLSKITKPRNFYHARGMSITVGPKYDNNHPELLSNGVDGLEAFNMYTKNNLKVKNAENYNPDDPNCHFQCSTLAHTPKSDGKNMQGAFAGEAWAVNTKSEAKVVYETDCKPLSDFCYDEKITAETQKANIKSLIKQNSYSDMKNNLSGKASFDKDTFTNE